MRKIKMWLSIKLFQLAQRLYRGLEENDRITVEINRSYDTKLLRAVGERMQKLAFGGGTPQLAGNSIRTDNGPEIPEELRYSESDLVRQNALRAIEVKD